MRIFFVFLILFSFILSASADTVFFKRGTRVDGTITSEDAESVTVDFGGGSFNFRKDEIERIDYKEEVSDSESESQVLKRLNVPSDMNGLIARVNNRKSALRRLKQEIHSQSEDINAREEYLSDLYQEYQSLSAKASAMQNNRTMRDEYIETVSQLNNLAAKSKEAELDLKKMVRKRDSLSSKASDLQAGITSDIKDLSNRYSRLKMNGDSRDMRGVENTISRFEEEFVTTDIPLRRVGGNYITDVRLNSSITVPLIVDTGASAVCISRETAARLNLSSSDVIRELNVTLADGSRVNGKAVILESVEVGGVSRRDVQAVIIDNVPSQSADGLLGMTFLGGFVCRIDARASKLVLESLE